MGRERNIEEYDSLYGTDHYITKWDRISADPSDAFADRGEEWFEQDQSRRRSSYQAMEHEFFGDQGLGDDYPRGV